MHHLPQLLELLNRFLKKNAFPKSPAELYQPCEYLLGIGGKRIRPALLLMGFELFDDRIRRALPPAAAIELFHNFTLMHDDIMDAAPLRRGHPTVHAKFGLNTGILSGDAMLIHAYRFLSQFRDRKSALDLVKIFNRVAIEVCEGQQMDINFETLETVSIPDYLKMIELKTAVLLGGALEMGATCARAPRADAENLYHFGRLAGLAFQIQDDLLDTFGNPETFGKQVGGDILQGKKTLLVLKTLETAPEKDRVELTKWLKATNSGGDVEKVETVKNIFERNGIPALVSAEKARFQAEAFRHMENVNVPEERKSVLKNVIEGLLERER